MIKSAAEKFYDSLKTIKDIEDLIIQGESEGLFLECKSISDPNLSKEINRKLAQAASGFSNTEGGVLLYGVSTTNHKHSRLDILTQVEPLGQCRRFAKQIENALPRLTTPSLTNSNVKVILEKPKDQRGVVAVFIPKITTDPIQSTIDNLFYYRNGDHFTTAPYEIVKRLFAASTSPDLTIKLVKSDISYTKHSDLWNIPIIVENRSIASAEKYHISITINSTRSISDLSVDSFNDMSDINPGKKIFMSKSSDPTIIYRGVNLVFGDIQFKMKPRYRKFKYEVKFLAHLMRARTITIEIDLVPKKVKILKIEEKLID